MGLYEHPKITAMPSGWYVVLETGDVYTEHDGITWKQILYKAKPVNHKQGIKLVGLKNRNKRVEISGKDNYIPPGNRFVRDFCIGKSVQTTTSKMIERFIGYYDTAGKVVTRVDIRTGSFRKEIEPY